MAAITENSPTPPQLAEPSILTPQLPRSVTLMRLDLIIFQAQAEADHSLWARFGGTFEALLESQRS